MLASMILARDRTMTLNDFSRAALLLSCLLLSSACSKSPPSDIESSLRNALATRRALVALPPACVVGTGARAPSGTWKTAPKAFPEAGKAYTFIQKFDTAMTTGTVRAGLNSAALRVLDKVETRDADGAWTDAGPVDIHDAPSGCAWVWLQQDLGGPRQVEALRYTFHRSEDVVSIADVGILVSR